MSTPDAPARLTIEVWSDIVCPWCYIGDARLEKAIEASGRADRVDVVVRTFQLDPDASDVAEPAAEHLAAKLGKTLEEAREMETRVAELATAEGLPYDIDHRVRGTLDLLRIVHLARENGVGWHVMKALQREVFGGAPDAFETETIVRIGTEFGLDEAEVRDVLAGDRFRDAVLAEHQEAVALGARGVPFTVLDRRLGIPGAVPAEMYGQAIAQAWEGVDG